MIYEIKRNPNIRAWLIMLIVASTIVLIADINSRTGVILLIVAMIATYGVAATYDVIEGKTPCKLDKIETGKLLKIILHKKGLPLLLWGVDAPEKSQTCHDLTVTWLEDFLVGKSLSFTDVAYIEYRQGIQRPKHYKYTSYLYADGQDVALEGLRTGHLYLTHEYKTNEMYRDAANYAESRNLGLHKFNEALPHIARGKARVKKNIKDNRTIENAEGVATWVTPQ